jgi:adenine-specific DNA-methyltransferase
MGSYEGRLELTWTNKHLRLLAHEDGSYEWIPATDYRVAEVRLLDDVKSEGVVGKVRARDNLMVQGDALNALTSLARLPEFANEYLGKVKLAYLDPPFNTQQSFLQYDDALEHSVWLTMIRDRLLQIRDLLSPDGTVWIHLDDSEVAYCRVLMDEIFGRNNFIATIVWSRSDVPRSVAKFMSNDQDYILAFARDVESLKFNRLPRDAKTDSAYKNPDNDRRGSWRLTTFTATKPYSKGRYEIVGPTGKVFTPPNATYWRRPEETFLELDRDGRVYWGVKGDAAPMIKTYLSEVGDLVPRTIWHYQDVGSSRTAKLESKALFGDESSFGTPKPERLLQRVIQIASNPGDIVLDCFVGSGTTAAVAQKMGRRWVAVERDLANIEQFAYPRLQAVVDGEDPGGISKDVEWVGGGGFRLLKVAPSMFEADDGLVFLADWMTNGELSEATAAQLGYRYEADPPFSGRKGRTRLAVVDGVVNDAVVRLITTALSEKERVVVCGTAIDTDARPVLRELRPGSTLRKIPAALLNEYRSSAQLLFDLPQPVSSTKGTTADTPQHVPN